MEVETTHRPVTRAEVVQGLLSVHPEPSYLEIGVYEGTTFHNTRACRKVAVDPYFRFDVEEARSANQSADYFQVTSDEYFGSTTLSNERFDVIYLDGLHTFEQTLRDLLNATALLKPKGAIVVDDVYPGSLAGSLPSQADLRALRKKIGARGGWMGDVYRLVFFIEAYMQQMTFRTVRDNHGQLVLWRAPRTEVVPRPISQIAALGFEQVLLNDEAFRFRPYETIRAEYQATVSGLPGSPG